MGRRHQDKWTCHSCGLSGLGEEMQRRPSTLFFHNLGVLIHRLVIWISSESIVFLSASPPSLYRYATTATPFYYTRTSFLEYLFHRNRSTKRSITPYTYTHEIFGNHYGFCRFFFVLLTLLYQVVRQCTYYYYKFVNMLKSLPQLNIPSAGSNCFKRWT